jgi:hypothetical protein
LAEGADEVVIVVHLGRRKGMRGIGRIGSSNYLEAEFWGVCSMQHKLAAKVRARRDIKS